MTSVHMPHDDRGLCVSTVIILIQGCILVQKLSPSQLDCVLMSLEDTDKSDCTTPVSTRRHVLSPEDLLCVVNLLFWEYSGARTAINGIFLRVTRRT